LKKYASRIRGIDLVSDQIPLARADGFDIETGDAETYLAPEPYEVVFAGDLIEHLSNPGQFLACSRQNLVADGKLILATPNTYSLAKLVRVVLRLTNEPPVNPEHTSYFTPRTLNQLLSRYGFRVEQIAYCDFAYTATHGSFWKRAQLSANSWLTSAIPQFAQVIILICTKTDVGSGHTGA
jgi:2-polyprenyl-3-methyl-5-hydroxy-6-metoxy-1,4-benzoquinol methylase